jgi:hypothetical protein
LGNYCLQLFSTHEGYFPPTFARGVSARGMERRARAVDVIFQIISLEGWWIFFARAARARRARGCPPYFGCTKTHPAAAP